MVEREFSELYTGELAAVHMVYMCPDLDKLVAEYDKLNNSLLDLLDGYTAKKRRGKPIKRKTVLPLSHIPSGRLLSFSRLLPIECQHVRGNVLNRTCSHCHGNAASAMSNHTAPLLALRIMWYC